MVTTSYGNRMFDCIVFFYLSRNGVKEKPWVVFIVIINH